MPKYVAGLDIGTTKTACIIAEEGEDGKMNIMGIGVAPSTGLRKGTVIHIDKTVEGIKAAVSEAELMAGYEISSVYVGIAGDHIQSINKSGLVAIKNENNEITADDVERAKEVAGALPSLQDREIIATIPQNFLVDDQLVKDPIGMSAVRLEANVHIITASVGSVQNIQKSVHQAGLEVNDIIFEPYASSYAVLNDDEKEVGVVLVDMGGGTTDIAIYAEGELQQTFVVGLGGEYVTKDIALGINTPLVRAEQIKKEHGCADESLVPESDSILVPGFTGREEREISRKMLATIIGPRMEEILTLVNRKIDESKCRPLLGAGIVLTGGGSELEGVDKLATRIFRQPIKLGTPEGFTGFIDTAKSPIHATGVGLCLIGLERSEEDNKNGGSSASFGEWLKRLWSWF